MCSATYGHIFIHKIAVSIIFILRNTGAIFDVAPHQTTTRCVLLICCSLCDIFDNKNIESTYDTCIVIMWDIRNIEPFKCLNIIKNIDFNIISRGDSIDLDHVDHFCF